MMRVALIAGGGALGTVLRYWTQALAINWTGGAFPFGTLAINILGCLLIGFLGSAFAGPLPIREDLRLAVLVGILGGFTTFSSFAYETLRMASSGQYAWAALYVAGSNVLGLLAAWLGVCISRLVYGAS